MSSPYGLNNCVGWYTADRGVYSDAAATAAADGAAVVQWSDLSGTGHHLTQPAAADRPVYCGYDAKATPAGPATLAPYGTPMAVGQPSYARSVLFDGITSSLSIPAAMTVPATGWTMVMCTRGPGAAPVMLGGGSQAAAYGWVGGTPGRMGVYTPAAGVVPFPAATVLPTLVPFVHGIRCSSALGQTRLYMGTHQTADLPANYGNAVLTGGSVGRAVGVNYGDHGSFAFAGELFELLIFNRPLADAAMATLLADVQTANRLRADADAVQVVFVGDDPTAGGPGPRPVGRCYPWHLCQQSGQAFKPVVVATPGHTVAQQQALVTSQVLPLDRTPFAVNAAVVCAGGTDLWLGTPAADVATAVAGLCSSLRSAGFKVVVATVTPRAAASTPGQVTLSAAIAAFNAAVRSGWAAYADAVADWATDRRLADYTSPTYYAADGWHTTDAGDGVKAALVRAAVDPILSPPPASAVAPLTYGSFYAAGRTFAGQFGRFPRG